MEESTVMTLVTKQNSREEEDGEDETGDEDIKCRHN
jgi:hypothetical protein